ncbi:MAG: glycosyltransferase family 4 protein [Gemmatimonadales bacterium]
MRIALVTDWYFPRFGGLELHLRDVALELVARGHEVHIVTGIPGDEELDGLRIHRLNVPNFPLYGFVYTPGAYRRIKQILQREAFDVIHVHVSYLSPTAFIGAYLGQKMGLPTVVTFHSFIGRFRRVLASLNLLYRWSSWPVAFSAVSGAVASHIRPLLGHRTIPLLPNGVDATDWRVTPIARDANDMHVVSVMRLKVRKRPRALLKIIRQVRDRLPGDMDFRVTIIGDGPERGAVERLIARFGLRDCVTVLGYQARDAIRDIFASADIFVLPTVLESFGIAALEARSAGLPVVAMAQTGISEFIHHGEEGLLANSDGEMVELLMQLIMDSDMRAAMAQHNREMPGPATSWSEVIDRHVALYQRAREVIPAMRADGASSRESGVMVESLDDSTSQVSSARPERPSD